MKDDRFSIGISNGVNRKWLKKDGSFTKAGAPCSSDCKFESGSEPVQVLNQMKRDDRLPKGYVADSKPKKFREEMTQTQKRITGIDILTDESNDLHSRNRRFREAEDVRDELEDRFNNILRRAGKNTDIAIKEIGKVAHEYTTKSEFNRFERDLDRLVDTYFLFGMGDKLASKLADQLSLIRTSSESAPIRDPHWLMPINESHEQGICPVCGESIYSDEGCVKAKCNDGEIHYVHDYHCTDDSVEEYDEYCDNYWRTHKEGFGFKPPLCVLKERRQFKQQLDEGFGKAALLSAGVLAGAAGLYNNHYRHNQHINSLKNNIKPAIEKVGAKLSNEDYKFGLDKLYDLAMKYKYETIFLGGRGKNGGGNIKDLCEYIGSGASDFLDGYEVWYSHNRDKDPSSPYFILNARKMVFGERDVVKQFNLPKDFFDVSEKDVEDAYAYFGHDYKAEMKKKDGKEKIRNSKPYKKVVGALESSSKYAGDKLLPQEYRDMYDEYNRILSAENGDDYSYYYDDDDER